MNTLDFWLDFAISIFLTALRAAGQDVIFKNKIRPATLKVFKTIKLIFVGDPDFA